MRLALTAALALTLSAPIFAKTMTPVQSAIADAKRPAADTARDAARKPAELIAFADIKPGQKVADFVMGGGYLTRIIAGTVGPKGVVYAYQPSEFVGFMAKYGTDQDAVAATYSNVKPLRTTLGAFALPEPVDVIVTVQNYHDLHLAPFPKDTAEKVNAALFKGLKPGGQLIVVDHVALTGSGLEAADKLHRIDPAIVRAELEKAGFRYDGEITTWRNTTDPHTANVFSPDIRGKTDQFAYRFRKPRF